MTKHLPIGGSTIARTINCPGWIDASKNIVRRKSSDVADLGNLLHDAMEQHYQNGKTFEQLIAEKLSFKDHVLDVDHLPMLYRMQRDVEEVFDRYMVEEYICEPFVQLVEGEAGGSIDMLALSADRKTIVCLDYKTGQNAVNVENNKQLQFYILCAKVDPKTASMFDEVENYVSVISQPKVYKDSAAVWEFDNNTLDQFIQEVGKAIEQTRQPNAPMSAGSHCMYCPNEPFCAVKQERAAQALLLDPENTETLDDAVVLALELKSWCDRVIESASDYLESGVVLKNSKMVHGRSTRKWGDTKAATALLEAELGDEAYTKKLISPAQATKKLRGSDIGQQLDTLIVKPEGNPTLAPMDDPREAIIFTSAQKKLNKLFDKKVIK